MPASAFTRFSRAPSGIFDSGWSTSKRCGRSSYRRSGLTWRRRTMTAAQKVAQISESWIRAIATNRIDAIEPYITEDWTLIPLEAGPIDRQRVLGPIASGALVHDEMAAVGQADVRVYGDSAVVITHVQNRGRFQGEPFSYDEWSTDTFIRDGDGWRCAVTALTPFAGG